MSENAYSQASRCPARPSLCGDGPRPSLCGDGNQIPDHVSVISLFQLICYIDFAPYDPVNFASNIDSIAQMLTHQESVDLDGDVKIDRDAWDAWLSADAYPCATAILRHALDQQGADMRGSVGADTAWELCCRVLSRSADATYIGSRDIAQLLVYWLEEGGLPAEIRVALYNGMAEELQQRGKSCQTDADEQLMKVRWLRLSIHAELDSVREARGAIHRDLRVDFDVSGTLANTAAPSIEQESEKEATEVLNVLRDNTRSHPDPGERPAARANESDDAIWALSDDDGAGAGDDQGTQSHDAVGAEEPELAVPAWNMEVQEAVLNILVKRKSHAEAEALQESARRGMFAEASLLTDAIRVLVQEGNYAAAAVLQDMIKNSVAGDEGAGHVDAGAYLN